jgi:Purple acid Phosphatase, N-terminal domain/Calcineurin-like phosphoesterase
MKRRGLLVIIFCFLLTFMIGCSQKAEDANTEELPVEQEAEQIQEENTVDNQQAEAVTQEPAEQTQVQAPNDSATETLAVGSGEIITVPNVSNELIETAGMKYLSVEVGKTQTDRNFVWYSKSASEGMVLMQEASTMELNTFYTSNSILAKTKESKTEEGYYVNKATVSDLKPNTTYHYVVGNSEGWSPIYTYKTSSFDTTFSFAAVGDPEMGIGTDDESFDQMGVFDNTINKINEQIQDVAFLLSTGDQVGLNDKNEDYASLLNHVGLYSLAFAPTIGNHDVGGSYFKEHFNLPNFNKIKPDADVTNDDYYFTYNGVLFLMINANNGSDYDDYHRKFIEEASAKYPEATWKVAVFHFPPFSAVAKNQNDATAVQELIPFLEDAGVDVVFNGHDQLFSRTHVMKGTSISQKVDSNSVTNPDGILYFTLGSSSGNLFHESIGNANAVKTEATGHPQASRVDVTPTSFKITTYNTDTWEVYDEFTINK